ncbi:MAG TPA: C25 family cysteine peptidase [Phycisphaerae bacterium]|nr:C25 family cysteine peptidase [Phycisphaerae bacterium]
MIRHVHSVVISLAVSVALAMLMTFAGPVNADQPTATGGSVRVAIPVGPYTIAETDKGQRITVEGFGSLLVPGKPQLPSKIFAIAIPPGAELLDVEADPGEGVQLSGSYEVRPAGLPRVIGREDSVLYQREQRQYDRNYASVYGKDAAYPQQAVEVVRTAAYRRYNLVDVRVTPFTYRPSSGELTYYPDVAVRVHYRIAAGRESGAEGSQARPEAAAVQIILNHAQALQWYPQLGTRSRGLHDYVIITLDSLVSAVSPLVSWETSKGRTVEVVTTSWIDANYSGYDLAAKMRSFLRDKYPSGQWGIEDVLLVGHYDDVPMRRTWQDLGYGKPETDFYYAELSLPDDQSWDADGDHQYGENSDPIDFYSEVNVGRIPWSDAGIVQGICEKSAAYEQNNDAGFKKNILLLGAYFWPDTDNAHLMEAKVDQPWMADWTMTRMYEQNADYWSSFACDYPLLHNNVLSVWANGTYAFVNWAGHGSPTSTHIYGLGAPAFIQAFDSNSLNDDYPAIVFADACSNSDTDYTNIGQVMIKRGAVGFLGATKVAYGAGGWNDPSDGSTQSLDYFFTTSVTSGDYTQGQAHQWALRQMYTQGLWYSVRYEMFEWGALWGNPNLGMAAALGLSIVLPDGAPELLSRGESTDITVRIVEGLESYVPGSGTLHYRYDGGVFQTSPLVPLGGDSYEATLPPANCADVPEYYFTAEGSEGGMFQLPPDAPAVPFSAVVGQFVDVVTEDLAADPGWATEGAWTFGRPTGQGGQPGVYGPDPTSGYTGLNVYGYNLEGNYPSLLPETHLTSGPVDCTGQHNLRLKFWRWLGVQNPSRDHAYVRVSNNGTDWVTVWENSEEIDDWAWTEMELDVSAVADDQPTVYLRWTMGATDLGGSCCGWNIDDIRLLAFSCPPAMGDLNDDGRVDLADYLGLEGCLTGPEGGVAGGCGPADFDGDSDVDLWDFAEFSAVFEGG